MPSIVDITGRYAYYRGHTEIRTPNPCMQRRDDTVSLYAQSGGFTFRQTRVLQVRRLRHSTTNFLQKLETEYGWGDLNPHVTN